jgi:hypothetical protein
MNKQLLLVASGSNVLKEFIMTTSKSARADSAWIQKQN